MTAFLRPGDPTTMLTAGRRRRDRDFLAAGNVVDVLVVGGGITGTGVALDAASRGLSVALVESHDLAFGTSRWSSKLVHGGLRYLASGQVGVAWESAIERALIATKIAPHLVRAFAQLIPAFAETTHQDRMMFAAGLRAGDALRRATRLPGSVLPPPRHISAAEAMRLVPAMPTDRLESAYIGWDGQLEDDARLVVGVARTAAAYGARLLTRTAALQIGTGGALVEDKIDGGTYSINARTVVNATGVWAGDLDDRIHLSPSRGTHLVVRSAELGHPSASLTIPVPGHTGRFVFAMPQSSGLTYVALTDVPAPGPIPDVPQATEEEIIWILDVLSRGLAKPLDRSAVVGTFAGLRPLVSVSAGDDSGSTADISRKHLVLGEAGEVITVTGGKLTTYRRMASDTVDRITETPCRTKDIPLIGAGPVTSREPLPPRLVRRYGSEAPLVADLMSQAGPDAMLAAEFEWGVLAEGAMESGDLLDRRTRVGLVASDRVRAVPLADLAIANVNHAKPALI